MLDIDEETEHDDFVDDYLSDDLDIYELSDEECKFLLNSLIKNTKKIQNLHKSCFEIRQLVFSIF